MTSNRLDTAIQSTLCNVYKTPCWEEHLGLPRTQALLATVFSGSFNAAQGVMGRTKNSRWAFKCPSAFWSFPLIFAPRLPVENSKKHLGTMQHLGSLPLDRKIWMEYPLSDSNSQVSIWNRRQYCLQLMFLFFKFVKSETKESFVTEPMRFWLASIGDVSVSIAIGANLAGLER